MRYATLRTHKHVFSTAIVIMLLAAALPASLFTPSPASGDSTWVITSLADDGGEGTLRYAVDNSEDGDVIRFNTSVRGTITLDYELGQLVLDHPLTIEGPGSGQLAISGANETRVLLIKGEQPDCPYVDEQEPTAECGGCASGSACASADSTLPGREVESAEPPDFTISGLTIRDGFPKYELPYPCIPKKPEKDAHGPGCYGGNVLCVRANATLTDCVICNGFAEQGGGLAARNNASLLLQNCSIRDNEAGPTGTTFPESSGGKDSTNSGGGIDVRNHTVVVLEDCDVLNNTAAEGGGVAIRAGGGSSDNGSLTLTRCTVNGNVAGPAEEHEALYELEPGGHNCVANEFYCGGGIFAKKTSLLVEDSIISENLAQDDEEKLGAGGGILLKRTSATISGCTISDNAAGSGTYGGFAGGIGCLNSEMRVHTCSVVGNSAGDDSYCGVGGGIYIGQGSFSTPQSTNEGSIEPGEGGNLFPCEIAGSLIAGNTAGSRDSALAAGGGFAMGRYEFLKQDLFRDFFEPAPADTEPDSGLDDFLGTVLTNCTISGNSATNNDNTSSGGGIANTGTKTLALNFCTVTENRSSNASGLSTLRADGSYEWSSPAQPKLRVKNSIIAGNASTAEDSEIVASWMSWEGNVYDGDSEVRSAEPGVCYDGGCGDTLIDSNPKLGPLTDNGGPTLTHALLPGSPAIDAACDCRAIGLVFYDPREPAQVQEVSVECDQRGVCRPNDSSDTRADAGAFQCQPDIALPDVTGDSIDAGQSAAGNCRELRVRVTNEGSAELIIDDILILGSDAFSVIGDYSGMVLSGGESMWITLRFCPESSGVKTATLRIVSNDPDEAPLNITIEGTGTRDRTVDPARMVTNYFLVDPQQVLPGQQVTVSANICNGGGEDGSQTAVLSVNGVAEQSQSVTVSPGACKQIVFQVAKSVPGTYSVSIEGMQGQFSVLAPRTVQSSVTSEQDNGLGTAGIIAIVAVVLALIAALVVIFRQS